MVMFDYLGWFGGKKAKSGWAVQGGWAGWGGQVVWASPGGLGGKTGQDGLGGYGRRVVMVVWLVWMVRPSNISKEIQEGKFQKNKNKSKIV